MPLTELMSLFRAADTTSDRVLSQETQDIKEWA